MTELSRRNVLAGAATLSAAALVPHIAPAPAQAAASAAGKQAGAIYRYKVGSFECTSINDGGYLVPYFDGFARNASKEQVVAAMEAAYYPKGHFVFPFNPQLVNTGSKLILIDTGMGAGGGPNKNPNLGRLTQNLTLAGIEPGAIDTVIISHIHFDHFMGLKTPDNRLAFPNAEIKVPAIEWAFWMSEESKAKAPDAIKPWFDWAKNSFAGLESKVTRYEGGQELAPGITAIHTPGHTPGHMSFAVASGSGRVLIQSDLTSIPDLFLRNPDWHLLFDMDPVQAVQSRRKFLDMAAAEKAPVVGYHFHFPAVGHVEKDGSGYRLVPVPWSNVL
jgi:glyoxylase-like metal-dependent hydrolase (beta-lactamase superfamily II)